MKLTALALTWTAGILLGHFLWSAGVTGCATPAWPFLVGSAAMLPAFLLGRRHPQARFIALLMLATVLGAWRYTAHPAAPCLTPNNVAYYHAGLEDPMPAAVEGVIISYPEQGNGQISYRLRAEQLWIDDAALPVTGDILIQTGDQPPPHYGDRMRVQGEIADPPIYADFDYRAYLARQGIYSRMTRAQTVLVGSGEGSTFYRVLYQYREGAAALLNRLLPEPSAALANGMLLGIESGIPSDVMDAFQATGTTHVIVISGSNIALLAGVLLALLGRFIGRTRAVIPVIVAIVVYVLLVGAEPSAMRAGLMGILLVGALGLGRQNTAWVALAASALLMTLLDPLALWDVGFQISFAATLGLIFFSAWFIAQLRGAFGGRLSGENAAPPLRALNDGLAATLAAQVLVIPVLLFHFGQFSIISLPANALILPAQPPILTGGMLTLLAGLIWEPLGQLIAGIPWLFLTYTTAVVQLMARVPYGMLDAGPWAKSAALVYMAVLASGLGLWKATQLGWLVLPQRERLALIGAAALPLWIGLIGAALLPDGRLHIAFQPAGNSETILLTLPNGGRLLIASTPLEMNAPATLITGPPFDLIIAPDLPDSASAAAPGFPERIDPRQFAPHTTLQLADGVTLERLGTAEEWALAIRYGEFQTIVPAALDAGIQKALANERALSGLTLMKLPGSETGCWPTEDFLAVSPPQTLLWPMDTTYPPSAVSRLTGRAQRVPGDAVIEVITDGKLFRLRQLMASPALLR